MRWLDAEFAVGHCGALDPGLNLPERDVSSGGSVIGEGDDYSVGRKIGEPGQWVGGKAGLGLLPVGDHRGSGLLEALDGVAERLRRKVLKRSGTDITGCEG
jgi:hypothetical protein